MSEHGTGNDWSPVNGKAPWWVNMLVWILRQGFLSQMAIVGLLATITAVFIGQVDSPMLRAFRDIAERSEATANRTLEMTNQMSEQTRLLREVRDLSREQRNISSSIKHNTEPLEQLKDINKR